MKLENILAWAIVAIAVLVIGGLIGLVCYKYAIGKDGDIETVKQDDGSQAQQGFVPANSTINLHIFDPIDGKDIFTVIAELKADIAELREYLKTHDHPEWWQVDDSTNERGK